MGERKVLNKYIPADFDPKLVPRGTKPKDDLVTVRMMLPFTIQCSTCSTVSFCFFFCRFATYDNRSLRTAGPPRPPPPSASLRVVDSSPPFPASVSPPPSLLSRSCHIAIYYDARAHAVPVPG